MSYSVHKFVRLIFRRFNPGRRRWWGVALRSVVPVTRCLRDQLCPFIGAYCFKRRKMREVLAQEVTSDLDQQMVEYLDLDLPVDKLKVSHEFELRRGESLVAKGRSNIAGVTIALVFVFGVLGLQARGPALREPLGPVPWLLAIVALYLLVGALCAFHAIGVNRVYDFSLQVSVRVFCEEDPKRDSQARLIKLIHLNQAMNLIIANFVSSSYTCMRNGIVGIVVFVIVVLL